MDPAALMALARHSEEVATVRAFQEARTPTRVVLLRRTPEGGTAMVEADDEGRRDHRGRRRRVHPRARRGPGAPRALPEIRPAPASAIHIDTDTGELAAPLGTVDHLARSRWRSRAPSAA